MYCVDNLLSLKKENEKKKKEYVPSEQHLPPRGEKKNKDVCFKILYKTSLYEFWVWTWSIFIMQYLNSDIRHLFWGLAWVLRVTEYLKASDFYLLRLASNCFLINIQIYRFKETKKFLKNYPFREGDRTLWLKKKMLFVQELDKGRVLSMIDFSLIHLFP